MMGDNPFDERLTPPRRARPQMRGAAGGQGVGQAPKSLSRSRSLTRTSSGWWSMLTDNPSDDMEATSLTGSPFEEKSSVVRQVRFHHSVDAAAAKRDRANNNAGARRLDLVTTSHAPDSVLDLISDNLCNYDMDSPVLAHFEDSLERRIRQMDNPVLRTILQRDQLPSSSESDEEGSEMSEGGSASSQSFDEIFADLDEQRPLRSKSGDSAGSSTSSKYKALIRRTERRKEMRAAAAAAAAASSAPGGEAKLSTDATTRKSRSKSIHKTKSTKEVIDGRQPQNSTSLESKPSASATVVASPFAKMAESFLETIGVSPANNNNITNKNNSGNTSSSQTKTGNHKVPKKDDKEEQKQKQGSKEQRPLLSPVAEVSEQLTNDEDGSEMSKENGLPSSVMVDDRVHQPLGRTPPPSQQSSSANTAAWMTIPKNVSSMTEDDVSGSRATKPKHAPLAILPEETQSRLCSLPALFYRRSNTRQLNRQKYANRNDNRGADQSNAAVKTAHSRSPSTASTSHDDTPPGMPASSASSNGSRGIQGMQREQMAYEQDTRRHSYVAYFQRGEKATKAIRYYEHPAPPVFPTLPNEVVVRIEASTVSETDCDVRKGDYWGEDTKNPLNLPIVPGVAFCGWIQQLERGRAGLRNGDRVASLIRVGANSRHLCIDVERLVRIPGNIIDAGPVACLPEIYLSAFQALHVEQKHGQRYRRNSLTGKSILILGGHKIMGKALIELAIVAGSGTIYATAPESSFGTVEEDGAIPIDKDPHHWYSLLMGKMDIVVCVDCDDPTNSELKYEHIQTLSRKGKLVLIGAPDEEGGQVIELNTVDERSVGMSRKLFHYNVFDSWEEDMKQAKKDLAHLLKLLAEEKLNPKIVDRVPLNKVAKAQEVVEQKILSGFVLCEPWLHNTSVAKGGTRSRGEASRTSQSTPGHIQNKTKAL